MTALWDAVCARYARPGVKELCLELQDAHGVDVPLLLVVATLAARGRTLGDDHLDALAAASAPWQAVVVSPLRGVRRALRDGADAGAALGAEADTLRSLKAAVQAAELAAERIQIDALERAAADWPADATLPPAEAVARVLARWGAEVPADRLRPLVD
ncbi:MAG: TIGR02444 family protein [Pseudomonadota bacterium]